IRRVVSNLLANAIEAVKEGGSIWVGTRFVDAEEPAAMEIVVSDNGCGIAEEYLEHIFEPFFTSKAGTGTGLGLWVAKEIVERHRGSIEVQRGDDESDRRGATFIVRLPAEPRPRISNPPVGPRKPMERSAEDVADSYGSGKLG
ncbi:MAG: ATP-binding protein, partial [Terracidiphilus sp.]